MLMLSFSPSSTPTSWQPFAPPVTEAIRTFRRVA